MRLVITVAWLSVVAGCAALTGVARAPAPAAAPAAVAPPPRATPDPRALVPPDRSLELDRAFIGRLGDRPIQVVRGLAPPIEGATPPTDPLLLPYSPRTYRAGVHEGIDFPARAGTPARAAAPGYVVRIDRDFTDWTAGELRTAIAEAVRLGYTPPDTLDRIRGRQVWIDQGRGVVTRYAHLSAVAAGLAVGDAVAVGQVIGAVGSSGFPEGGPHLHFEVRIGEGYLGSGLGADELARVIARAFGPGRLAEAGAAGAQGGLEDDLDGLGGDRPR